MDDIINPIGLVSSILITIMFVPQVSMYTKPKTLRDQLYFLFINLLASVMGLIYSIYFSVVPMSRTHAGLFSVSLVSMKCKRA